MKRKKKNYNYKKQYEEIDFIKVLKQKILIQ